MVQHDLSDTQWCLLDLLMRARQKGVHALNRLEILHSPTLPRHASIPLAFAALVMPSDLVEWKSRHDFAITPAGVSLYNLRFGKGRTDPQPTQVADAVICLPGPQASLQS